MELKNRNQEGGIHIDDRGVIRFINDFPYGLVRRMYQVENLRAGRIRAWHGHRKEEKFVYVPRGIVEVKIISMDKVENKTGEGVDNLPLYIVTFILSSMKPSMLHIPAGYYNGFKTLTDGAVIQFFSSATLEESKQDDFRLSPDHFGKEVWEEKDR